MLPALKLGSRQSTRSLIALPSIQVRQWNVPRDGLKGNRKPRPVWVSPETKRREKVRNDVEKVRLVEARAFHRASIDLVENSRSRELLRRIREIPAAYYLIGVAVVGGVVYIWWSFRKKNKQARTMREAVAALDESQPVAVVDKDKLPRPLVVVGGDTPQKYAVLKQLLRGREEHFGYPVLHTSRKARQKEEEGIAFWFAPKPAVEQAVHLGAFVSHGTVRVGDKYIMYGLSKGAVADVRTSGRICLLDLDLAGAEALSRTDLKPLIVLVSTPEQLEQWKQTAADQSQTPSPAPADFESKFTGMWDARQKGFFHHEVLVKDTEQASIETASNSIADILSL